MFKKLTTFILIGCFNLGVAFAQTGPSVPTDGFWTDSIIASLKTKIDTDRIGANSGVAGLNSSGYLTSPINTPISQTYSEYTAPDGTIITLPQGNYSGQSVYNSFFILGAESASLGGQTDAAGNPVHQQLSIVGMPFGNYNAGCTLCIFSTSSAFNGGGAQAGLSGADFHGGAGAISGGDAAMAGFYQYDENFSARVTAQATAFTATTVTLKTALTNEQMATLHNGMYIATNVIDTSVATTNTINGTPNENAYWGFIKSWTANTITVYGWAVLGAGNSTSGQIPDVSNLDTTKSTYTVPMVFIGVPGKIWSKNTYVVFDGDKIYGSNATTRANAYEREELDFRGTNFTNANSFTYHGWTTSYQCIPCSATAAGKDSYAYMVNGPGLPRAYVAQLYGDGLEYSGYSTWLPGNGSPDSTQGSNHIMYDFASSLTTNNTLHFGAKVFKDLAATTTWQDYSIRLGMNVDGTRTKDVYSGGSEMAYIVWNYNGGPGTLCILSTNSTVGLCQNNNGVIESHLAATFDTTVSVAGTLTAANSTTTGTMIIPFGTPASSTADCTEGQMEMDATYIYSCVASNMWHRVNNGATW